MKTRLEVKHRIQKQLGIGVVLVASLFVAGISFGAMERGPAPRTKAEAGAATAFDEASAAVREGDCGKALPLLERTVKREPKNAEALNLLAYCQRKSGRLDEAFTNYRRALELRPQFPAAREYLGEAHVQAALEQVEILRSYGETGQKDLDKLITALRDAAATAAGEKPPTAESGEQKKNEDW